jgi:hypothetical protein
MAKATATPAPRQRKKPTRFTRLIHNGPAVVLRIRQVYSPKHETLDYYTLESVPAQIGGRGFLLVKEDGTSYHARLDGNDSTCDCPGQEQWGHLDPCKHIAALLKLQHQGKL